MALSRSLWRVPINLSVPGRCPAHNGSLDSALDGPHGGQALPGGSARILRGRGSCRADGRAGARSLRRARLRAQGDRPQQARGGGAARARGDLRGGGDRGARGRHRGVLRPRRGSERARQRRGAATADDRRHLPARHEGARGGAQVRRRGLHDRPDRPLRPRGGRGHDGRGARAHRPRRDRGRRRRAPGRGPGQDRLHLADDALGRRDARDHQPPPRALPEDHRAAHRRHLLRDDEPPGGRQADGAAMRSRARHRLAQLVELEPARRGRAPPPRGGVPDRQRGADPGGVARGRARRRDHLRGERARGARPAPRRLLPRAGDGRRRGVPRRPGGRALHAAQDDPAGARGPVRMRAAVAACVAVAALLAAGPARAAAPDRLRLADARPVPIEYFQGLTHDRAGARYFDGVVAGLYRTDRALRERGRNPAAIPPAIAIAFGFDHIGDIGFSAALGGVILPFECFTPGAPNGGNTCGQGGFGVADPATLQLRYVLALDPRDVAKAMWAEVSPDGTRVWTSAVPDLIAYRTADVSAANAAAGVRIRPVARLAGAVPPSGVTGAAFRDGRLLLAGQQTGPLELWSIDVRTGARRREAVLHVAGESEGLDTGDDGRGLVHWLVTPFDPRGRTPTDGGLHSEPLSFVPAGDAQLRAVVTPARLRAGRTATLRVRVTLRFRGRVHAV